MIDLRVYSSDELLKMPFVLFGPNGQWSTTIDPKHRCDMVYFNEFLEEWDSARK